MIKEKKKPIILIVLVLILVVEIIFLVRRMTLDKQANQVLAGVMQDKVTIEKTTQDLSQKNLENFATDKQLLQAANNTQKTVDNNISSVEKISDISNKVKQQKQQLLNELKEDSNHIHTLQNKIKASQSMMDIFGDKPFEKNSLVKDIAVSKIVEKSVKEELDTAIKSLPNDEQSASLKTGLKQIADENNYLISLNKNMSEYIENEKVKTVPTSEQYKKLSKSVTNIKNEKLKKEFSSQLNLLQQEVMKNDPSILNDDKKVALTFDDGPNNTSSLQILDTLKKYDIKATFFMLGSMVDTYPDVVKKISEAGHDIGNHTYDHKDLTTLDEASIKQEIDSTNQKIEKITGKKPELLRPPYGAYNERVTKVEPNMSIALWNIDTLDWKTHNPTAILGEVKKEAQPHSIVLMHDIHKESADSLENVIKFFKSQDYTFVPVKELLN